MLPPAGRLPKRGRCLQPLQLQVCDDKFSDASATVACRGAGFKGRGIFIRTGVEYGGFGPGTGQIMLNKVVCLGNETSLDDCRHEGWGVHNWCVVVGRANLHVIVG